MLTTRPGLKSRKGAPAQARPNRYAVRLLRWGRRIAARASDVSGIWPWSEVVPFPSGTAHISAVLGRGKIFCRCSIWRAD